MSLESASGNGRHKALSHAELVSIFALKSCPDCKHSETLKTGPRVGLAVQVTCSHCGASFNMIDGVPARTERLACGKAQPEKLTPTLANALREALGEIQRRALEALGRAEGELIAELVTEVGFAKIDELEGAGS